MVSPASSGQGASEFQGQIPEETMPVVAGSRLFDFGIRSLADPCPGAYFVGFPVCQPGVRFPIKSAFERRGILSES